MSSTADYIHDRAVRARAAAGALRRLTTAEKNALLLKIADALDAAEGEIAAANAEDVAAAEAAGLAPALVDRLTLTPARFRAMTDGVRHVADLPDPVGETIWTRTRPSGIAIEKVREPFGVIACVFESRPNVFVDTAALCLKTGNAIILRGGKEALRSNAALAKVVVGALALVDAVSPGDAAIRGRDGSSRQIRRDLSFTDAAGRRVPTAPVDAVSPGDAAIRGRDGSSRQIRRDLSFTDAAGRRVPTAPVDASSPGDAAACRVREDELIRFDAAGRRVPTAPRLADAVQFVDITDHAAVTELVRAVGLVDVAIPRGGERLIRAMCEAALIPVLKHYKGVCHLYVDDRADLAMALAILDNAKRQRPSACNAVECLLVHERLAPLFLPMVRAWASDTGVTLHEDEPGAEYLSLDLNVATVRDVRDAIDFINRNSSHHSDAIVTADAARAAEFLRDVDSACVYHNASTRFTDGAEFGMGAEIGISTDKLHARGPMGLEELTTYKYRIVGDGAVRT